MAEAKKTTKKVTEKNTKTTKVNKQEETQNGNNQEDLQSQSQADEQGRHTLQAVESKPIAKAGKRSAKAIAEIEEKQAKEERKKQTSEEKPAEKPKTSQKPARSKLERRSKAYKKVAELVDRTKSYNLSEGLDLAIKTSPVKFDASVELHVNLNVDPKQADQNIRGTVALPAGTGKEVRVAVFGEADEVETAKKAGADQAAGDEFLQKLDKGQIDFDVLIASPKVMPKLGKYAKVLGPKGLMPNPKSGTVTTDVGKAVKDAKAGQVEYRVDSTRIIHVAVGKVSFGADKLNQNATAVIDSLKSAKPSSIKGNYIKSSYITTSMGPSIKVTL